MPEINSVAVFCGSHPGHDPAHRAGAYALGRGLARTGRRLVFGGGRVGLMGAVADGAIEGGGQVIGVIPEFLTQREVAHQGVSELIVTDSMHTRKRRMFELSDAFVTMPGGLGTMDETFEIITWRLLDLHDKPILLCDVAGSAGPLVTLIEALIGAGFARPEARSLYDVVDGVPALLDRLDLLAAAPGGAAALL